MSDSANDRLSLSGGHNPRLSGEEQDIKSVVDDIFRRQGRDAAARVEDGMAGGKLIAAKWDKEVAELIAPVRWVPFKRGGDAGLRSLPARRGKSFELPEWIESPQVIEALKRENFLFARTINDTTANTLQRALIAGMELGETIQQLKQRIVTISEEWEEKGRAEMIARTESARAFGSGQVEAWKQTGIVTAKKWSAAGDSCPFCAEMDGEVVDLDESYFGAGSNMTVEFEGVPMTMAFEYGAVGYPPLHPNCRCAIVAELSEYAE